MNTEKAKRALQAVLLFHGAGPWDGAKRMEWVNIMAEVLGEKVKGNTLEATTRNLCNLAREALEAPEAVTIIDQPPQFDPRIPNDTPSATVILGQYILCTVCKCEYPRILPACPGCNNLTQG